MERNPWESCAEGNNWVMLCTILKGYFQLFIFFLLLKMIYIFINEYTSWFFWIRCWHPLGTQFKQANLDTELCDSENTQKSVFICFGMVHDQYSLISCKEITMCFCDIRVGIVQLVVQMLTFQGARIYLGSIVEMLVFQGDVIWAMPVQKPWWPLWI